MNPPIAGRGHHGTPRAPGTLERRTYDATSQQPTPLFTALALIAIVAFAGSVDARSLNPDVVDPNDDAYGKSYEDWSVAWWQ